MSISAKLLRIAAIAMASVLLAAASNAQTINLSSATADVNQSSFAIGNSLIDNGAGWATLGSPAVGIYTTNTPVGLFGSDATLSFSLDHADSCCNDHQLGHFRLSATSDPIPSAAGSWTVLNPTSAVSTGGETMTINPGVGPASSVLVTDDNQSRQLYTVQAPVTAAGFADGVTGFRLEIFDVPGNGLPTNGPGTASNGNFVLTHFSADLALEESPFGPATNIAVANHSFEDGPSVPSPPGFSNELPVDWQAVVAGGGGRMTDLRPELTTRPDGTATHAWSNGNDLFQVTGETIQANTLYTLSVDVGARGDLDAPAEIRLGAGSTFNTNLLDAMFLSDPTPSRGTWETWEYSVFIDDANPFIGELLRIELLGLGIQPQFDNVRLTAQSLTVIPEPTSVALWSLLGVGLAGVGSRTRRNNHQSSDKFPT